jgi:T5SS/PEP-CTERM-associated repeat protein/autotransporter-associated beta strand protein
MGLQRNRAGTGTIDITDGGTLSSISSWIGLQSGCYGTVTVGGGTGASTWTSSGTLFVGTYGTGLLNINDGGLVTAEKLAHGNAMSSVNFNGGTLRITTTGTSSNAINLLAAGGTIDVPTAATTFTVTSGMAGAGGLTKTGAAQLALTGANSYSGDTNLSGGTLALTDSGSFASSPTISVDAGATLDVSGVTGGLNYNGTRFALANGQTLKGNGTVVGAAEISTGSTLAPGNSAGTLSTDSVSITGGGTISMELAGTDPGVEYDRLIVTGELAFGGTLLVETIDGFAPELGDSFDLFGFTTASGAFNALQLPDLEGGLTWDTSQLYTDGVLSIAISGDFNDDGVVSMADYFVWRKMGGTQAEYDIWHSNFGTMLNGRGLAMDTSNTSANVPEPSVTSILVIAAISLSRRPRTS